MVMKRLVAEQFSVDKALEMTDEVYKYKLILFLLLKNIHDIILIFNQ